MTTLERTCLHGARFEKRHFICHKQGGMEYDIFFEDRPQKGKVEILFSNVKEGIFGDYFDEICLQNGLKKDQSYMVISHFHPNGSLDEEGLKKHCRKGIGSFFLEEIKDHGKNFGMQMIFAETKSESMMNFLEKHNFSRYDTKSDTPYRIYFKKI